MIARWVLASALMCCAAAAPLEVPFVRQEKNGCGAASVAMVAQYWGDPLSPTQTYQQLYDSQQRGVPLAGMKGYLENLGYDAFTLRGRSSDLDGNLAKGRPVIVGLKRARDGELHFVVLVGADTEYVWMNDPARRGLQRVKRANFERQWQQADRWMLLATPRRAD